MWGLFSSSSSGLDQRDQQQYAGRDRQAVKHALLQMARTDDEISSGYCTRTVSARNRDSTGGFRQTGGATLPAEQVMPATHGQWLNSPALSSGCSRVHWIRIGFSRCALNNPGSHPFR